MTIDGSAINCTGKYVELCGTSGDKYPGTSKWRSGNEVPSAALVIGDNSGSYGDENVEFQVDLTLQGTTTLTAVQGAKAVVISEDDNSKVKITDEGGIIAALDSSLVDDRRPTPSV